MATQTVQRPTMTAQQATSFERTSAGNALKVSTALKCGCEPYKTVFTYNRWLAQGMQVQRGEKAIRLPMIKAVGRETQEGQTETKRIFTTSRVFCRHQVKPVTATDDRPAGEHPKPTPKRRRKPVVKAQQPIIEPTPAVQPQIDAIMGQWKEIN